MMPLIEVKLTRQTLLLTEKEIISLLALKPELWETAIRRGKGVLRARKNVNRQAKARGNLTIPDHCLP